LIKKISLEKIQKLIVPYKHIRLAYLARTLSITEEKVELYLRELLFAEKVSGYVDAVGSKFSSQ